MKQCDFVQIMQPVQIPVALSMLPNEDHRKMVEKMFPKEAADHRRRRYLRELALSIVVHDRILNCR